MAGMDAIERHSSLESEWLRLLQILKRDFLNQEVRKMSIRDRRYTLTILGARRVCL